MKAFYAKRFLEYRNTLPTVIRATCALKFALLLLMIIRFDLFESFPDLHAYAQT